MKKFAPAIVVWASTSRPIASLEANPSRTFLASTSASEQNPESELLHGHLQREKAHGLPLAKRHVLSDVQGKRGLADRRTRGEDDEVRALEPRGHPVEDLEARREAGEHALAGARILDDLQVVLDDLADGREGLAHGVIGDFEDFAGDVAQELLGCLVLREPLAHDPLAGTDQAPQRRLFLDDARVVLDVADVRHAVEEPGEIGRVHGLRRARVQFFLQRQQIDLGGTVKQVQHPAIDPLVLVAEEVLPRQDRHDERDRYRVEQDRSQDGAFGLGVLRQALLGDGLFKHRFWGPVTDSFTRREAESTAGFDFHSGDRRGGPRETDRKIFRSFYPQTYWSLWKGQMMSGTMIV